MAKKVAVVNQRLCVACGCCTSACKLGAIAVCKGIYAQVDSTRCVGCGMCAKECPASIITLEEVKNEKK